MVGWKEKGQELDNKTWRTDSRAAYALICNMAGRAKEIVLPEPVWEIATTSRPLRAMGHAWHWMGVGSAKPCCLMVLRRYSGKPTSSKPLTGLGMFLPCTWTKSVNFSAMAHEEKN